jgi:hypothetical protein
MAIGMYAVQKIIRKTMFRTSLTTTSREYCKPNLWSIGEFAYSILL